MKRCTVQIKEQGGQGARGDGFTMIELLGVLGVLILLVMILVPSFARARYIGKEAVCMYDIRSLHIATLQYASGEKGRLPDLARSRTGGATFAYIYWTSQDWRVYMEGAYSLKRIHWYSPCNPAWNKDMYYLGLGSFANAMVMGRFYFSGKSREQDMLDYYLDRSLVPVTGYMFPTTTWDDTPEKVVWADISAQYLNQWGDRANHRYGATTPIKTHKGTIDGSVVTVPGSEIKMRYNKNDTAQYWW